LIASTTALLSGIAARMKLRLRALALFNSPRPWLTPLLPGSAARRVTTRRRGPQVTVGDLEDEGRGSSVAKWPPTVAASGSVHQFQDG